MLRSMTGYGYGAVKDDDYLLEVEIKSYNNRYLEIQHNISYTLSCFESYIDSEIKKVARRGHIELSVRLKVLEASVSVNVDRSTLSEYRRAFSKIEEETGLRPSFSDYMNADGVITLVKNDDSNLYKEALEKALSDALGMLSSAKEREGRGTYEDLLRLGKEFKSSVDMINGKSREIEQYFRLLFSNRYSELLSDKEIDEERLTQEVTLMMVKYSINEEIKRLYVHLDEYFKLLESTEAVGKRLDFLSQEMNRETNTIASKSSMAEISSMTVIMKDSIENIREQVRNIE